MPEVFGSASYYGIGKIIKQYSKFPSFLPLPVNIQHGYVAGAVNRHDARRDAPENWYWDEDTCLSHMRAFPGIGGRAVGAPFLYLLRNINFSSIADNKRKGTIVFPSHSSALVTVKADFATFADELHRLPEKFHPITVCAYHLDFERGVYRPFRDKGFEIVTNGRSLYEKAFMKNFVKNAHEKKFAITSGINTPLLFSNVLGLITFIMGPVPDYDIKDTTYMDDSLRQHKLKETRAKYLKYFTSPDIKHDDQKRVVLQLLGTNHMLSPEEMNRLLWQHALSIKYVTVVAKTAILSSLFGIKRLLRMPSFGIMGKIRNRK